MSIARLATVLGGAAVVAAALAGCSSDEQPADSSASVSAAASTEAGESSAASSSTEAGTPSASEDTALDAPVADAPANSLTMKCSEFMTLDAATQKAVATAVIAGDRTKINSNNTELASTIAKSLCTHYPDRTVNSILGGPE